MILKTPNKILLDSYDWHQNPLLFKKLSVLSYKKALLFTLEKINNK